LAVAVSAVISTALLLWTRRNEHVMKQPCNLLPCNSQHCIEQLTSIAAAWQAEDGKQQQQQHYFQACHMMGAKPPRQTLPLQREVLRTMLAI
jgi:hypothetical protein